jgi:hypothetical protein
MPPSATMSEPAKAFLPRWAVYALIPGFAGPVLILGFIFVSQLAYDDARCPYVHTETRQLTPNVAVREERRSCLWNSEERRFSVVRGDRQSTLGRRRFRSAAFDGPDYHWQAELSTEGEVRVVVHNPGHVDAAFREGTAAERQR